MAIRTALLTSFCALWLATPARRTPGSAPVALRAPDLDWGAAALTGPYPSAPLARHFAVDHPDGTDPRSGNIESLQYHHHTRVAVDQTGRIWVAYSGGLRGEGESGSVTEVKSSGDNGVTWSPPTVVVASASVMDGSVSAQRRISYPRAFVTYRGQLYLVAAIDSPQSAGCCSNELGLALVASAMHADGSVGEVFLVSAAEYKAVSGYPSYRYDPALGLPIFTLANNFGTWGGSAPGYKPSAWVGYAIAADGTVLVEPGTVALSADSQTLLRLWRDEGATGQFYLYASKSYDYGASWSPALPTNIPDSPSETTIVKLANGHIAVIGDARDRPGSEDARDPLFLAVFDAADGRLRSVYSVISGLGKPEYDNRVVCGPNSKPCGAGYPGAYEYKGTLWISYSVDKQSVWVAALPSANL